MKKLAYFLIIIASILGCKKSVPEYADYNQHVYHTFYGDIDIDSIEPIESWGDTCWYPVAYTLLDSTICKALDTDSIIEVIYYSTAQNLYFFQLVGNNGISSGKFTFNPYDGEQHTIRDYYLNNNETILDE